MRKWNVVITETLSRTVSVEAESCEEAEEIVGAQYEQCEILLLANDHILTEITAEHEGICPLCGAEIVYSGHNVIDDNGGLFPWRCPGCGAHGDESYLRKFDGHIHIEEGKDDDSWRNDRLRGAQKNEYYEQIPAGICTGESAHDGNLCPV